MPMHVTERLVTFNILCFSTMLTVETLLRDHIAAPGTELPIRVSSIPWVYVTTIRRLRQTAKNTSLISVADFVIF